MSHDAAPGEINTKRILIRFWSRIILVAIENLSPSSMATLDVSYAKKLLFKAE